MHQGPRQHPWNLVPRGPRCPALNGALTVRYATARYFTPCMNLLTSGAAMNSTSPAPMSAQKPKV